MTEKENNRFLNITAGIFLAGFSVFVLKELSSIFIPLVLAIIISFIFEPFFSWMKSKKVPSGIAIAVVILVIVTLANIASLFIVTSVNSFSSTFSVYEVKFLDFVNRLIVSLNLSDAELQNLNNSLKISNLLQQGSITSFLANFFTSFLGIFGDFVLIIFYVIFILSEMSNIKERIHVAFSKEKADKIISTLETILIDLRTYISGKTIISLVLGFLSGLLLKIFGVEFYFICGFLIFIMHFIPSIGALIAISLPAMIMFLQFDNIVTPIIVTSLLIIMQNVVGNIVEPKVMGDQLDLSPLLLLFSLFLGGYIWGIVGMVLSVPIVSMIKIILMNFDSTRPMGILMSYKSEDESSKNFKKAKYKKSKA
ncbi:MAG TPA: AI-2E family transporter [Ignavibacteria bacterium]|nr:AI-2E family transporter [Ignavibacteria bacterium]